MWLLPACWLALVGEPDPADHTVISDRPDIANSSITVPRGGLQLEIGFNADLTPNGERNFPLGIPTALRLGITRRLELRFFDGETAEWPDHDGVIEPREAFGAKVRLVDEDFRRWRPAVALQPLFHIGIARGVLPVGELTLIVTQPFGELVMLDMNFGGAYELGAPHYQAVAGYVAGSLGVQVHPSTLIYTEMYVAGTSNISRSLRWGGDGGLVVSITPRFAMDLAARVERFGGRTAVALIGGVTGLLFKPCHPSQRETTRRPICRIRTKD